MDRQVKAGSSQSISKAAQRLATVASLCCHRWASGRKTGSTAALQAISEHGHLDASCREPQTYRQRGS